VRPQEFAEGLLRVPFLYIFLALAVFGLAVDIRLRIVQPRLSPQIPLVVLFVVWCALTVAIMVPEQALGNLMMLVIPIVVFVVLAQGVQTFKAFEVVAGTMLAIALFLAAIGIHQGVAPWGCVVLDPDGVGDLQNSAPDGRPCEDRLQCMERGAEPGKFYLCERVGLLGTSSVAGGRVRYLGILQDPNELSMTICIVIPFAFAFFVRKKNRKRLLLLLATLALITLCTIFTKSRGGILVFLAVVGLYAVHRYRWKGIAAGAVMALPLLLLGGRGGEEAGQSSMERIEAWHVGFNLFRASPLFGVGEGQFTEYHYLTAHNSWVLVMAELGLVGMFLWTAVVYLSVKIAVAGALRYARLPEAGVARVWALALLASLAGMLVGILFLSFSYHAVLWIHLGLAGAFYGCARAHDPAFRVRFGPLDAAAVAAGCVAFVVALYVYLRLHPV
jgi:O-antigen ligase